MISNIIHITLDEKFINSAHWQFENAFPNANRFYVYTSDKSKEFKYIIPQPNIFKFNVATDLDSFLSELTENAIVVFHSLSDYFFPLILKLPNHVHCVWMCFGFEIYSDKRYFREASLLDSITKKRFGKGEAKSKYLFLESIRPYLRRVHKSLPISSFEIKKKAISRMNFIACSFEEEQNAIQKLIRQKKKTFPFWYYPIEQMVNIEAEIGTDRSSILVGNSGFSSGNHLDVFDALRSFQTTNRTIVVPLSYGNAAYSEVIIEEGKMIFGKQFQPLTDFMLLSDYNQILKKCGVAVLNNYRQQAVGNTISLLWFGCKVFLSARNPFYHYLKRIGVVVFCFESELNNPTALELLSNETIQNNRKLLFSHLNTALLQTELKKVISQIN